MLRKKNNPINYIILCSIIFLHLSFPAFAQKETGHQKKSKGELTEEQSSAISMYYFEGLRQKSIGEMGSAVINFNKVISIDINNSAAYYELGQIYFSQKRNAEALLALQNATKLEPLNEWYLIAQAEVEEKLNNFKSAEKIYLMLIKLQPLKMEFHFSLATMQLFQGNFKGAIKTYNSIEKQIGISEEVSLQKEKIYLKLNEVDKAVGEIQKLIDYSPSEMKYRLMLGEIYTANNFPDKALATYLSILEIDNKNGYAQLALADCYRERKDEFNSFEFLKKAFENPTVNIDNKVRILSPYFMQLSDENKKSQAMLLSSTLTKAHQNEAKAFAIYGDFLYQDRQLIPAKEAYLKTISFDKKVFAVWQNLLFIEAELGDYGMLLKSSEEAIVLYPNQAIVFYMNAVAKSQGKDYSGAESAYLNSLSLVVDNKELEVQLYAGLGDVYHNLKDNLKSDEAYDKALAIKPDEAYVLNNYAYYLSLRVINLDKAERMSKKSNELQVGNSSFQDTYAWILFKLNRMEEALVWIEKSMKQTESNSSTVLEHYGDILFKLGRVKDALFNWKLAKEMGEASMLIDKKISEQKLYE